MKLSQVSCFFSLSLFASLSLLLSLLLGSSVISFHDLLDKHSLSHEIIFAIRLPRVLNAFVTGALLALAGALMQVLLRNPLADPYVLGTSGGAATVTLILMLSGMAGISLTLGAWVGSLFAMLLVLILAHKKYHWNAEYLILIGVSLASGFSAIISLILFLSPDRTLRGMLFWLTGDLSDSSFPSFGIIILVIGYISSSFISKELNILVRGEKEACALGVNTIKIKMSLFFLTSILTATAVTLAGCIGFVGLIIPHVFRLMFGYDHRYLIPGCILLGGSLLTLADMLSRTLIAPQEIPVGVIMALIGIPVFLCLLQKK